MADFFRFVTQPVTLGDGDHEYYSDLWLVRDDGGTSFAEAKTGCLRTLRTKLDHLTQDGAGHEAERTQALIETVDALTDAQAPAPNTVLCVTIKRRR